MRGYPNKRAACSNLDSEIEIVFRSARHDSMKTVHGVVHAMLGIEESVGLCRVCQVRLDCDSTRTWRSFGLDYVDKNQTKAREMRICVDCGGELSGSMVGIRLAGRVR